MEPNAILAINSLDRYNATQGAGGTPASFSQALENQYNKTGQPCNNFQVGGFGALIYGYIKKIQISQIQLQYNVPTVIPGRNDVFMLALEELAFPNQIIYVAITIPFGFYTPQELAAILQIQVNLSTLVVNFTPITITYRSDFNDYKFEVVDYQNYAIFFPDIAEIQLRGPGLLPPGYTYLNVLKCYRLLGVDISNSQPATIQASAVSCEFLYTPYIDICSVALTKYQRVKDNSTNATAESSLVSRIYLSGTGTPQNAAGELSEFEFPNGQPIPITQNAYPLGSRPFLVVQDCNTPKVVRWSKDETVYALDFQVRDQYGDLLFTQEPGDILRNPIYYTEFQMTLMCIEGER